MNSVTEIQEPNPFVFLDLEDTVIKEWSSNPTFLIENLRKIDVFLNGRDIHFKASNYTSPATPMQNLKLGLMSWAVWNSDDKEMFNQELRPVLELNLKRKFDEDLIWSMDDWANELLKCSGKKLSREDLFDIFGKPEMLTNLARKHERFRNSTIFLIDDAYEHQMTFRSPANRCHVEFQNIYKMDY